MKNTNNKVKVMVSNTNLAQIEDKLQEHSMEYSMGNQISIYSIGMSIQEIIINTSKTKEQVELLLF